MNAMSLFRFNLFGDAGGGDYKMFFQFLTNLDCHLVAPLSLIARKAKQILCLGRHLKTNTGSLHNIMQQLSTP